MATYNRPGVYVEDVINTTQPIAGATSDSIAAFAGVIDRGPTTATLVTSWSQYTSLFGSWGTNNLVTTAVSLFFANGGNRCYIQRVVASDSVIASRTIKDTTSGTAVDTIKLSAISAGAWGNNIRVAVTASVLGTSYFNLNVYYGGATDNYIVERFVDITMNTADARYAIPVINASSKYVVATDMLASDSFDATDNPAVTSASALTSGADGTAVTTANIVTGLAGLDVVNNALILNVPGVTSATDVNNIITYATNRNDTFVVVDGVNDTVANQLTLAATYTVSTNAAVYYPVLTIPSPVSSAPGATWTAFNGGAVVGKMVSNDAARGVFKAPAGIETRLSGVLSVATLTNANLDSLNSATAPVNAIRYVPGAGIVIMGARTLDQSYAGRYVPVRRSIIYLHKALADLTQFAIFEPNDVRLWNRLTATVQAFLTDFWQKGGLSGQSPTDAFFVKCDGENNTSATVAQGQVLLEVGVALRRPAEFVIIRISQYDSGAVVTIS